MDKEDKTAKRGDGQSGGSASAGADLLARLKANIAGLGALTSPDDDDELTDNGDSEAVTGEVPDSGDDLPADEYGYTGDFDDDEPDIPDLPDDGEPQPTSSAPTRTFNAIDGEYDDFEGIDFGVAGEGEKKPSSGGIKYSFRTMTREEYVKYKRQKSRKGILSSILGKFGRKNEPEAPKEEPYVPGTTQIIPQLDETEQPAGAVGNIPANIDITDADDGEMPSEEQLMSEEEKAQIAAAKEQKSSELDKTEEQLMIGLGMEDELKQQVSEEKADEIEARIEANAKKADEAVAISDETRGKYEYVAPEQTKSVFKYYRACYRGLIWRLAVCVLLTIGVFLFENIPTFGGSLPKSMDPRTYPVVYLLIGMQFTVLAAALIWKPLYRALREMIAARLMPESITLVTVAMTLLYELIMCFAYGSLPAGMIIRSYNLSAVLAVLLTLIFELLNVQREIYSFNITASKKNKFVVARLEGEDEDTRRENELFADSLGGSGDMFCVRKSQFVDGFFRRVNSRPKYYSSLNYLLPAAVLIGLVFFIYGLVNPFARLGAAASFMGGYAAAMMVMPAMALFNYCYPFYKANKEAFDAGSTIVGDVSLEEYSTGSAISFDDREVFPASRVKIKKIQSYGETSFDRAIYYAAMVFRKTGGPLDEALRIMTSDFKVQGRVELLEIAEDGINAVVDGVHILIGRADYMIAGGIRPVNPEEDEEIEAGGEVCVMYMSANDKIAAKFKIQYIIDDDFESILQQLSRAGMCVGIRTFDPNINDRMLSARVRTMRYPVRVIKCRATENRDIVYDRYASGVISRSSVKELLQTQIYCDRVLHTIKTNTAVKIFSMVIGAVIMGFIVSLGLTGEVNSLEVALYQLFWLIPAAIVARLLI